MADRGEGRHVEKSFVFDENPAQRRVEPRSEPCSGLDARAIFAHRVASDDNLGDATLSHRVVPFVAAVGGAVGTADVPLATQKRLAAWQSAGLSCRRDIVPSYRVRRPERRSKSRRLDQWFPRE